MKPWPSLLLTILVFGMGVCTAYLIHITPKAPDFEAERDDHDKYALAALTEADELLTEWETQEPNTYLCAEYVLKRERIRVAKDKLSTLISNAKNN
jgi:hypothetical protein